MAGWGRVSSPQKFKLTHYPTFSDDLGFRAVVTNNGPNDAEAIQVLVLGGQYFLECIPNGVAVCGNQAQEGQALIPHLAAGATTSIDFLFDIGRGPSFIDSRII
jgi:hypothetical protein